jgi:hypothetical protein
MKKFLVTNVKLTENDNTSISLKQDGRAFVFGGVQTSSATGTGAWIALTGDRRDKFVIDQIIDDVPADAYVDEESGELIIPNM